MDAVDNVPLPVDFGHEQPMPAPYFSAAQLKKRQRPTYRKIKKVLHRCDDCMLLYVQGSPPPGLAEMAHWERRITGHGARYLCRQHADQWRERDQLPPRDD